MLRDDVLIENNKYGCIIMQNNWAMKIVNFTHAQTAETRHFSVICERRVQGYSLALIISLEDLVVKQAHEQSGHVSILLLLAKGY